MNTLVKYKTFIPGDSRKKEKRRGLNITRFFRKEKNFFFKAPSQNETHTHTAVVSQLLKTLLVNFLP